MRAVSDSPLLHNPVNDVDTRTNQKRHNFTARVRCDRVYVSEGSFSFRNFLKPHTHTNRNVSNVHRAKHHANSTSSNRTIIIHLEGVDLHTYDVLALTKEKGKIGSPCNESYFIIDDLPVVNSDGSSGEIEVDEALHAELSVASWHVCIRQQSHTQNGEWTHIGKYERYPSTYEKRDYGKK
ncbi:uncharacterized protein TNIN_315601 [Trichonephila inaurata madagascariensis]|uniref:Uncharacterized protein n=1 Tax=Trichonephila inaurata madagascariensis TaxID=2747483 RepID=A0A8X6YXG0_9ARAC|nr:uncharacterized protein TNIN_315601 [Trichonephila inaurata madagascariensis]